jgi:hypothetical protein
VDVKDKAEVFTPLVATPALVPAVPPAPMEIE